MGKKRLKSMLRQAAAQTMQETDEMKQRRMAQEQALATIRSQLGAEGTYETPAPGAPPTITGAPAPDLFKRAEAAPGFWRQQIGQIPDPEKIAARTMGSAEFRIASRMTAEAEQLLKREGPLWDEMNKSVVGPIMEGSASFLQEQSEGLRRMYARGGAARNRARQGIQQMRVAEQANRVRTNQLWNSSLALNQWARDNARTQLDFNQNWAANTAGVRDSFYNHLDNISKFMVESSIPMAMNLTAAAEQISEQQKAQKRAKIRKIAAFGIGAAAVISGGLAAIPAIAATGAGGLLTAGVQALGGPGALFRTGASSLLQLGMGVQPRTIAAQQFGALGSIRGATTTETEAEAGIAPIPFPNQ